MKDKKRFIKPEVELVLFASEDIIVTSAWSDENEQGSIGGGDVPSPVPPSPFGWW